MDRNAVDDRLSNDDLIDRLLDVARSRLGMDLAWLSSFVADEQIFERLSGPATAFNLHAGASSSLTDSYCTRVLDGRLPNLIPDSAANLTTASLEVTDDANIGSYIGVPIATAGGASGMLCCVSAGSAHHLGSADVQTLELLAELIAEILKTESPARNRERAIVERVEAAIANSQMSFVFQPIVEIASGIVVAAEALCRFDHAPVRSHTWFSEAASVGLGVELELEAIRCALASLPALDPAISMTVNASPITIRDPRLLELLVASTPQRLIVEITEHTAIENYELVTDALVALRKIGVRIAVDDAGAGFASLAHIREIRPAILKIDRSVVRGIHLDPARSTLAQAIISVGERVGATIVAEGVEAQEEMDCLAALGVQLAQGYLFAHPGPLPILAHIDCSSIALPSDIALPASMEDLMLRRFELAMVHSPVAMALVSPTGDVIHANSALASMLDYNDDDTTKLSVRSLVHPADEADTMQMFEECVVGTRSSARSERRMLRSDGTVMWADTSIVLVRSDGRPAYFILQALDVTERRRREHELVVLADTDFLTGLANRSAARRRLEALVAENQGFAILYCDVRSFKAVNDEFGHGAGDHVLKQIADRLALVSAEGIVSRWGGDEFLLITHQTSPQQIASLREQIDTALERSIQLPHNAAAIGLELTIGHSAYEPGSDISVERLLHQADSDMYRQRSVIIPGS